ncbi:MAG: hypothetical protein M3Z05_22875 [Gemmatimonadota bacterium]|nr:hypothetical protein [Gemmatimonadota bacterium]
MQDHGFLALDGRRIPGTADGLRDDGDGALGKSHGHLPFNQPLMPVDDAKPRVLPTGVR